jgi:zinc protease
MQMKKNSSLVDSILFLTLVSIATASCASKTVNVGGEEVPREQKIPFVGTFQVHKFMLGNGLKVLVVEDHSSPTFTYHTWYRVGSRDEIPGYTGLAHLFEHMMFKETKNLKDGEFDRILEMAGAEGENAFTSRDYTTYVQELPSDKLDLIAKLESDRMVNLIVNEKAFKTETEVVQNERRSRNENSPDGLMYQELFTTAFTKHPYRWPVIGYQEDLDRMSAKDAMDFYRSYYSPNHATIVVVGDVKPSQVISTIEKYYEKLPPQPSPIRVIDDEPTQTSPRRKQLKLNIQVEKLMMGYHIPATRSDELPALRVAASLLAGGKSARLQRALVDTGIASSVGAFELEDKDPSLFVLAANLQKGRSATQAETVILREIQNLLRTPVGDLELERAKNRINFSFYEGLNDNSKKARFLGAYEALANDFQVGLKQQQKIASITSAEVQAVIKKYLDPRNRSVITGVKK